MQLNPSFLTFSNCSNVSTPSTMTDALSASAIKRFWHPGLKNIFLCHLSENNNTRDLAFNCSLAALQKLGVRKGDLALRCLPRQYPSPLFNL